jgi:hypothetical protein
MPDQAATEGPSVRAETRAPRKHGRPDPRSSRLAIGVGALAVLSVMGAGIGRLPVASAEATPSSTGTDPAARSVTATRSTDKTRVERPVRYVRLKPGQKAPPGARVIREKAPAPRVVVRWVPSASSSTTTRAPVARTRQSG